MDSPLGPTLADTFLVYLEKNWLECCSLKYRPFYYWRYVDGVFVLFNSTEHLKRFQSYLNSYHVNMSTANQLLELLRNSILGFF